MSAAPTRAASAIILAAGASTRMGRPKALLDYRGETFVNRLVGIFGVYCEDVLVVASGDIPVSGARLVINPAPERGMLSSLQCGFGSLAPETQAAAFIPVDYPSLAEETVARVVAGWSGELLRIPRYRGRRGHPVMVSRELIAEFLTLPLTQPASEVVHRHERDIVYVDVDDPGILSDVDTPADYEQLR